MGISSFIEQRKHKVKDYDEPTTEIKVDRSNKIPHSPETMSYSEIKVMDLSMIFVDIEKYSKLVSEHRNSEVIARIMRIYITEMVSAIRRFNGTVISIEGDGILAAFHSQSSDKHGSTLTAFYCAVTMSELLKEVINSTIQRFKQHPLKCRYAIDYGRTHIARLGVPEKGKNELLFIGEPTSSVVKMQSEIPTGSIGVTERVYKSFPEDIQDSLLNWGTWEGLRRVGRLFKEDKGLVWEEKRSKRFGSIYLINLDN